MKYFLYKEHKKDLVRAVLGKFHSAAKEKEEHFTRTFSLYLYLYLNIPIPYGIEKLMVERMIFLGQFELLKIILLS